MWFFDFIKLCESSPLQISYAVSKATPDLAVLFESYVARTLLEIGDIFTRDEEFIRTRVTTRDLPAMWRTAAIASVAMLAGAAAAFVRSRS